MDMMQIRRQMMGVIAMANGGRDLSVEAAIIGRTLSGNYENDLVTAVGPMALSRMINLESVNLPNCLAVFDSAFRYSTSLVSIFLPKATSIGDNGANYAFGNCTALERIALPSVTAGSVSLPLAFQNDTALIEVDIGDNPGGFSNQTFSGCTKLQTLILRRSNGVWLLNNTNVFNNTRFANGGAGGTIYIPKAMYDHLGDGTALDYKSATNWSTIDGYGTITWAKIEGTAYEYTYADGTSLII